MAKIKEFEIHPAISIRKLEKAGFRKKDEYYFKKYMLYSEYIYVDVVIDLNDKILRTSVKDEHRNTYFAFYDYNPNNKVATKVINEYNTVLYSLCKRKILRSKNKTKMNEVTVNIKKLSDKAIIPKRGSNSAAGYDLYACIEDKECIHEHSTVKIPTNIAMEIPEGYFGAIFARSGLATKYGLRPANCVGELN